MSLGALLGLQASAGNLAVSAMVAAPAAPGLVSGPGMVLGLQRAIGNRAVAQVIARQQPPPTGDRGGEGGDGGRAVRTPDATSPTSGVDWATIWEAEGLNLVRTALEVTRLIPAVGLWGGLAADAINAYQDITSVPEGDASELMTAAISVRHVVNAANNAVGAVLYVDQLIQDGLAGSVIGAEFVPFTFVINEIGTDGKVILDGAEFFCDASIAIAAHYGRVSSAPGSSEEAAWQGLVDGYQANMFTDLFSFGNDMIGLLSGGASQSGGIGQATRSFGQIARTAKWAWPAMRSFLISLWNVWGSKTTADHGPTPSATPAGVARALGGVALHRQSDADPLAAFAWDVATAELRAMKGAYEVGDALLGEAGGLMAERIAEANEFMTAMLDGREPFEVIKETTVQMIADMNSRVGTLGELAALATDAQTNAASVREGVSGLMEQVRSLTVPSIEIPTPELGEGVAADIGEAVLGAGAEAAGAALELVVDQVRDAVESAKEGLLGPLQSIIEEADGIGEFLAIVADGARIQVELCHGWVADLESKLAHCDSFPEMLEALVNQALDLVGIEGEFSFEQLHQSWKEIGPLIEEAIAYAEGRATANRGDGDAAAAGDRRTGGVMVPEPPPAT